ncbi:MAG: hypothetical protein GYB31_20115 [Bacteroidetes bacterium]|nr:hypothetical protein [Bacteroidota bacterium]
MANKKFDILKLLSKEKIVEILERIGKEPLTKTGHGFEIYGNTSIKEAAEKSTLDYTNKYRTKPAIGILSVVLAANRNYNKVVEPNLKKIEAEKPNLKRLDQLSNFIIEKTQDEFYTFWGHKDEKKYNTLKNILAAIEKLRKKYPNAENDFALMNKWATDADLLNYNDDLIGKIPNIGIATFQHLRMVFGVDTIKPDQRVKEVLDYEFNLPRLSNLNVIRAVEQIAYITNSKVITIDQILVKYGSSHYNQSTKRLSIKEIAKRLKEENVSHEIISKATSLSIGQIDRIEI